VALLATLLVGHRGDRTAADRRVNRIHGYEPERDRIPSWAYAVVGVALWILLLPAWVPATVGDRLYVAGGRRDADGTVARVGTAEREGLGNAVAFASDAAGAADWPPLLDRLSLISMADAETGRVRGTSRQEARTRLARIRVETGAVSTEAVAAEIRVRGHDQSERGPLGGRVDRELAAGLAHDPVDQPDTQSVRVS